jgi:hypothetical protein
LLPVILHPQTFKGEQEMKRLVLAIALTCALSGMALGGNIPSSDAPVPPPPNPVVVTIVVSIISAIVR